MKFNILIIDEDLKVLKHIEELLNKLKVDGEFIFAENSEDALIAMEQTKINIVISDIKMAQINEEDILEVIKNKYPATIRIVLYDLDNKMQLMLKSIVSTHRYIAKPIELEKFNTVLLESIQLNTMLNNENLSNIINKIGKFPALPQTYIDIEDELTKENFSLQKISEIVHSDMIITTRILQVVNSPFIGLSQDITDIGQAVSLLGVTMIKSLI
nr:HDOD domain-containing protein [Melioribacteraceae bacterium]